MARTEEIVAQAEEGKSMPVWQLASILRISKRRPRVAVAPIYDSDNNVVTSKEELSVIWAQPFAAEFFGQVTDRHVSLTDVLVVGGSQSTVFCPCLYGSFTPPPIS